jgi:hypothetical protein
MPKNKKPGGDDLTAFKASLKFLREKLSSVTIDPVEFQRKLKPCGLSCSGMCCYDGASVDEEMGMQIQTLVNERRPAFKKMGLHLPTTVVETNEWSGAIGKKTAVRPFPFRLRVNDYPSHFNETACVFLLTDGRCGLQILSEQEGKHPWYYKPFTCWLQPIKITVSSIKLYNENTDPNRLPGYDGFVICTQCGRTDSTGRPASEVLEQELQFLGKLLDRNLVAEAQGKRKAETQEPNQLKGQDAPGK